MNYGYTCPSLGSVGRCAQNLSPKPLRGAPMRASAKSGAYTKRYPAIQIQHKLKQSSQFWVICEFWKRQNDLFYCHFPGKDRECIKSIRWGLTTKQYTRLDFAKVYASFFFFHNCSSATNNIEKKKQGQESVPDIQMVYRCAIKMDDIFNSSSWRVPIVTVSRCVMDVSLPFQVCFNTTNENIKNENLELKNKGLQDDFKITEVILEGFAKN